MARYATTQSQYTPYSFENLWKASEYLTQQHQIAAANFAQLDSQASPLQVLQNNPVDANEYGVVKNYMQQLQTSADKFQKQGLRGGAFNDFVQLNRNYTTTIKPIETALGQRNAYAAVQAEMKLKDNSIQFTKRPTDISLKEFMSGTVTPEFISGAQVQQEVGMIASQIAEQLQTTDVKQLNKYYLEFQHKYGLNLQEIQQQLTSDPNSALMTIVNGVISKYPQYQNMNEQSKAAIFEYAKQGAYQALGKTTPQIQQSPYFQQQQLNLSISANNREQEKWDITKKALLGQQSPPRYDSEPKTSAQAQTSKAKEIKAKWDATNEALRKIANLGENEKFLLEDLPDNIRKEVASRPGNKGVSWQTKLEKYALEQRDAYQNIVKLEHRYDIPTTLKDYPKLMENIFTGDLANITVKGVDNPSTQWKLGDVGNGVPQDVLEARTVVTLDPSIDPNYLILDVPTKYANNTITETKQVKLPITELFYDKGLIEAYAKNLKDIESPIYNPARWKEDYEYIYNDKEKVRAAIYQEMLQNIIVRLSDNETGPQEQSTTK